MGRKQRGWLTLRGDSQLQEHDAQKSTLSAFREEPAPRAAAIELCKALGLVPALFLDSTT